MAAIVPLVTALALLGTDAPRMSPERATIVREALYDEAYVCMRASDEPVPPKGLHFTARLWLDGFGLVTRVTLEPSRVLHASTRECLIREIYRWSFAELTAGSPRVFKFCWRIAPSDFADWESPLFRGTQGIYFEGPVRPW